MSTVAGRMSGHSRNLVREGEEAQGDVMANPDLLRIVFANFGLRQLCSASCVCRAWRSASHSREFWEILDLSGVVSVAREVYLLVRSHAEIRDLNIKGVPMHRDAALSIFQHLNRLEQLEMGAADFTSDCLELAPGVMPLLQTWRITEANVVIEGFNPTVVAHDRVRSLTLDRCKIGHLRIRGEQMTEVAVTNDQFGNLSLETPLLTSLSLRGCYFSVGPSSLVRALERVPHLRHLDVSNTAFTDDMLREVGRQLQALEVLVARWSPGLHLQVGNLQGFAKLRKADFTGCTSTSMSSLADGYQWQALEELVLDSCEQMAQLSLSLPNLQRVSLQRCHNLQRVGMRCPRLAHVDFGGPQDSLRSLQSVALSSYYMESITWQGLLSLTGVELRCPSLTSLDLSFCPALNDTIFQVLGAAAKDSLGAFAPEQSLGTCPALRSLVLENCMELAEARIGGNSLELLNLAGCKGLRTLELSAPSLQRLQLEECEHLTSVVANAIGVPRLALGTCPRLLRLHVQSANLHRLDLMGCAVLEEVSLQCPSLERLDFTYCQGLPDDALARLPAGAPRLSSLVLSVCTSVGTPGLYHLKELFRLRMLDLSYTDIQVLDPVFESCPLLEDLKLLSCQSLRPEALKPLLPPTDPLALPQLSHLDVSYCARLTSTDVANLLLGGSRFKAVEMNGIEGLAMPLCTALNCEPGDRPHALQSLSVKSCKTLRAFWLGLEPLPQPGLHEQDPQQPPVLPPPRRLLTPLSGLKTLRLGLSCIRALSLDLPHLTLLDASHCPELWRLHLSCPSLQEAYFQSCRCLSSALVVQQVSGCPHLSKLGLPEEAEQEALELLKSSHDALQIVPSPAAGHLMLDASRRLA